MTVIAEDDARDNDDEPFEGESTAVRQWGCCSSSERASSRDAVPTRAGVEERLRRGIIRERRENADSVSDKEAIDSAV